MLRCHLGLTIQKYFSKMGIKLIKDFRKGAKVVILGKVQRWCSHLGISSFRWRLLDRSITCSGPTTCQELFLYFCLCMIYWEVQSNFSMCVATWNSSFIGKDELLFCKQCVLQLLQNCHMRSSPVASCCHRPPPPSRPPCCRASCLLPPQPTLRPPAFSRPNKECPPTLTTLPPSASAITLIFNILSPDKSTTSGDVSKQRLALNLMFLRRAQRAPWMRKAHLPRTWLC